MILKMNIVINVKRLPHFRNNTMTQRMNYERKVSRPPKKMEPYETESIQPNTQIKIFSDSLDRTRCFEHDFQEVSLKTKKPSTHKRKYGRSRSAARLKQPFEGQPHNELTDAAFGYQPKSCRDLRMREDIGDKNAWEQLRIFQQRYLEGGKGSKCFEIQYLVRNGLVNDAKAKHLSLDLSTKNFCKTIFFRVSWIAMHTKK